MQSAKPNPVSPDQVTITINAIPCFHARGMRQVHRWRLTRLTEFLKFYTYRGEIWAAKDGRLLVRFKFRNGLCVQTYEICGMTAADLLKMKFGRGSDEAMGLKGNLIALRVSKHSVILSGSKGELVPPEENLWLSWVPKCVREAWDRWVDSIEDS